jgi:hypothetical protein
MQDKIQKVINLYEESYDELKGIFVYVNLKAMDTDFTSILFQDDTFYFEFCDDDIEDFQIKVNEIKDIKFDKVGDITVSIIELIIGDIIMICNL